MDDVRGLTEQVEALERSLGAAQGMAASFDGEINRMRESFSQGEKEAGRLSTGVGRGLRNAFDGLVFDGAKLSDALKGVAASMLDTAYSMAMRPVQNAVGGALAGGLESAVSAMLPFANGGAFSQGRVMPFASGGVVTAPTAFPMRGGTGLMGEAGPEAIMPLTRGADGRLGVAAAGGGGAVNVTINVTTPDVEGFRRSQGQIAAEMGRALSRGQRNR